MNDLQRRLINFASEMIQFTNSVKKDYAGTHLSKQLIRSSTSPALNYSEAQSAESKKDFVHKNKIALKELNETRTNLLILENIRYGDQIQRKKVLEECNQLFAILTTIVQKVQINNKVV